MERSWKLAAVMGVVGIFYGCDGKKSQEPTPPTPPAVAAAHPATTRALTDEDFELPMEGWDAKKLLVMSAELDGNRLVLEIKNDDEWALSGVKVLLVADGESCEIDYKMKSRIRPRSQGVVKVPIWFGSQQPLPKWSYRMTGGTQFIEDIP